MAGPGEARLSPCCPGDALDTAPPSLRVLEAGIAEPVLAHDRDRLATRLGNSSGAGEPQLDAPPASQRVAHAPDRVRLRNDAGPHGHLGKGCALQFWPHDGVPGIRF